ncbi:MAG: DUF692 domain-containing protein [Sulfuricellaceae bacterium]|nr:DUF692 domain-containing protein [Sulfuricellaceae bacterium]
MLTAGKTEPGLGLGLRHCHAEQILAGEARVNWFEAISENYMDSGGKSLYILRQVAERYPVVLHGVSMSIGSTDPLDFGYLRKLKLLAAKVSPRWLSDHLCWTGINGINTHDLLPVPLTEETLKHIAGRVNTVQDFLQRQLVLENPSTYLSFAQSTISEPDFLRALVAETGCALLLDVNNVYVTSFNADKDPLDYLNAFPFEHVVQMHLAGHEDCGTHVIDTHDRPVRPEVWELFRLAWARTGGAPTSLEWDGDIPSLAQCEAELFKAQQYISPSSEYRPPVDVQPGASGSVSTPVSFMIPNVMDNTVGEIA